MGSDGGLFPAVQQSALRTGSSSPSQCEFCGHGSDSQRQKLCKPVHPLTKFLGQCIKAKEFGGGGMGGGWSFLLNTVLSRVRPFPSEYPGTQMPQPIVWSELQLWPAHQGGRKASGNDGTIDLLRAKRAKVTVHPSVPYSNVQAPEDCSRPHPPCPVTAEALVADLEASQVFGRLDEERWWWLWWLVGSFGI